MELFYRGERTHLLLGLEPVIIFVRLAARPDVLSTADGIQVVSASQDGVCFYLLNEPVTMAVKLRAHESYVCGKACMMRNLRKTPHIPFLVQRNSHALS